ncbi:cytochrome P450 [Rhypophila sp. PSN 637]
MDIQITALLSLLETLVTITGGSLSQFLSLTQATPIAILQTFLTFFTIQYALLKIYRTTIYPFYLSPLRHLLGPKNNNLPLLGQFYAIFKSSSPFELPVKWANTWPEAPFIRYLGLGNAELLVMNTPEAHKAVLQTYCYDFVKPEIFARAVGEFVGEGILFAKGVEHRRLRRILQNTLSVPTLKRIMPTLRQGAANLTAFLNKEIGDADGKMYIDAGTVFGRAMLDLTGMTVLGVRLENLKSENPKYNFMTHYHRILDQSPLSGLITILNTTIPIRRFLPLEANRGYQFACREVKRMTLECVHQREREVSLLTTTADNKEDSTLHGPESRGRDMLTMLIQERKNLLKTDDEMTDLEICDQLLAFVVGSHETTASSLTWAIFVLVTRPEIQDKLRAEIIQFVTSPSNPDNNPGTDEEGAYYNAIESLPYLHNFAREVMRLYCPVTASWREAAKDLTICGTFIPAGTAIHFLPAVVNLSKKVWGNDADEFRPERWDSQEELTKMGPYGFMAFSHGPRVCIGKHYGQFNFKMMLVELLSNFRFGSSEEIERDLERNGGRMVGVQNPGPSLRPRGKMMVSVEKLKIGV